MNKKILMMIFLPLTLLFSLFVTQGNKVFATEHGDVITRMYLTDSKGNELTSSNVDQWQEFRINVEFKLHNNEIKAGDTTDVQLPDVVTLASTGSFDIKDQDGNVVAKAVVDQQTKVVTITYEPYVETHSDVKGTFYFYVRADHNVIKKEKGVPIDITVGGKLFPAGKINFTGIAQAKKEDLNKVGWQDVAEPTIGRYSISVNRSGKAMSGVKIADVLKIPGATYKQDTFRVYKGVWAFRDGDWVLDNAVDITGQTTVNFTDDNFSVQLPDLSANEGIRINYSVQLPYAPSDGENFLNAATLTTTNGVEDSRNSTYTYYLGHGEAEGYTYKIQIKKVSDDGSALPGAKFDIIRDRSGQVVAQVVTNDQGIAEVSNLLKDDYTIRETEAPAGYELANDVKVSPDDFDSTLKMASKTIVDRKQSSASAQLMAQKVMIGRDLNGGEFFFTLYDKNGSEIETVNNAADGSIKFSPLTFTKAGTYTYTIREKSGNISGVVYDSSAITAKIKVKADNQGKLVAKVSYDDNKKQFTNTYVPGSTTAQLKVKKFLTGRDLKDGEFSFELRDAKGKVVETVKNKADGSVDFKTLAFTKTGTYTYTIREVKGDAQGVTYDNSEIKVTITVTNENGNLLSTVSYEGGKDSFTNSYQPPKNPKSKTPSSKDSKKELPNTGSSDSKFIFVVGLATLMLLGLVWKKKHS